jgi:hypothetical protein
MASSSIWWCFCIAWWRVPNKECNWPVLVMTWIDPRQRSHQSSLTVIQSSYCSKLLARSISVTLKAFWIVWIGKDSCYSSLYMIECSLIDLVPELGHPLVPLFWLLWSESDHTLSTRWKWWAIIPSCPAVMRILFYHAMETSCYHSFWTVKSWLCLRFVTLGSVIVIICKCLQIFS